MMVRPSLFPICVGSVTVLQLGFSLMVQGGGDSHLRWKEQMAEFEKEDEQVGIVEGGIVFTGSSSVRMWNLAASFPGRKLVNRGFGGSQMSDAVAWFDTIVGKHEPSLVILYEGDNDLASGKTPEDIRGGLVEFLRLLQERVPEAELWFLTIKPSPSRAGLWDKAKATNQLVEQLANGEERLRVIDLASCLLDSGGNADPSYFREDRLHLNERGYAKWSEVMDTELAGWQKRREVNGAP